MERKTKVEAENGSQALRITREFDLPVELLFRAFVEPEIVEQWMGTKVLKLENKNHGGWQFETTDPQGGKHRFNGVIHEIDPYRTITRTFEFENTDFGVQLEFIEFERLPNDRSRLLTQTVFKSVDHRDQMLRMPFTQGINTAHDRLEKIVGRLK